MKLNTMILKSSFFINNIIYIILFFAFIIRLNGLNFGLPYIYDYDEVFFINPSIHMLLTGDLNPHWFGHPGSFVMYLFLTLFSFLFILRFLFGYENNLNEFQQLFTDDPTIFYFLGRLIMVLSAIFTIYLIYLIALKIFNKPIGLLSSFLLAISPLHVEHSRYIRTDIIATMLIMFSIYLLLRFIFFDQDNQSKLLYASSLFAGFSIATKYTAGIIILPILAHCMIFDSRRKYLFELEKPIKYLLIGLGISLLLAGLLVDFSWVKSIGDSYSAVGDCHFCTKLINQSFLLLTIAALLLIIVAFYFINIFNLKTNTSKAAILIFIGFFVFAPYIILDPLHSITDIMYENTKVIVGSERLPGMQNHIWYLTNTLQNGIGGVFFEIFAGVGLLFIIYLKSYEKKIFLIFPIVYFLIVGSMQQRLDRWFIPLLPFEAIFFGVGFYYVYFHIIQSKIFQNLKSNYFFLSDKFIFFLFAAMIIFASLVPIINDIYDGTKLTRLDTRTTAKDWIEKNLPSGSIIAYESYSPQLFIKSKANFTLIDLGWKLIISQPLSYYKNQSVDYIIITSYFKDRFYKEPSKYEKEILRYEQLIKETELIKTFESKENPGPVIEIYSLN